MPKEKTPTDTAKTELLRAQIKQTKSVEELSNLDRAKAKELGIERTYDNHMKKLEEKLASITKTGEDAKKKVEKNGGDPAVVEEKTKKAAEEATEVVNEADKEMKKKVESTGESIESETFKKPALSESYQETEDEIKAELKGGEPTAEKKPSPIEVSLDAARTEYFAAHKEFMDKRGEGFLNKTKNWFKDTIRFEDVKDKEIRGTLETKQKAYNEALLARGNEMLEAKTAELTAEGKTPKEIETELEKFKINTIFDQLVVKEKQKLIDQKKEQLPSKLRAQMGSIMQWYAGLNRGQKFLVSLGVGAVFTSGFAATSALLAGGSVGVAATAATAAAAKAFTLKAIGIKAAGMASGALAGATVGTGLNMAKNAIWGFDRKIKKAGTEYEQGQQELAGKPLTFDNLKAIQAKYDERLRKEASNKAWKARTDMFVGFGSAIAGGFYGAHLASNLIDNLPDITPPHPQPPHPPTPPPAPHDTHIYKELKVEYSSRGSIDTWAHVKHQLTEAYKDVPADKIPPEYDHIMHSRADALAKEFGEWRPADANESLSVLKGSTIEFDKTGKIISHSLKNIHGVAEDQVLAAPNADGTAGAVSQQANERFFHYGGEVHAAGDAIEPPTADGQYETGIGSGIEPPHGTDANGFWDGNSHTRFESHVTHVDNPVDHSHDLQPAPGDDPQAWDGKRHSKFWWKHHPDGIDHRAEARLNHRIARLGQGGPQYNPFWSAVPEPGNGSYQPIMSAADPAHWTQGYQHAQVTSLNDINIEPRFPTHGYQMLEPTQVENIMHNPARFIGTDFLDRAISNHDKALPFYRIVHDLQTTQGMTIQSNETLEHFMSRARYEHSSFFLKLDDETTAWLTKNHLWGK